MRSIDVPEIEPLELARRLEGGEPLQVLDVRAPRRLSTGRVEPVSEGRFHNVPGSEFVHVRDPAAELGLVPDEPVAVVCGRGNDSRLIAGLLGERGYEAASLRGGVTAWMRMVIPRELDPPPGFDRLVQFDRIGKGALGYLLVAEGEALVVDPPRDWDAYAEVAEVAGARVVAVADTHVHADYISGAPAIASALGVRYYLHPADNVWPYDGTPGRLDIEPLAEGAEIPVGGSAVVALHTPGHTEGSVTLVTGGTNTGDGAALTGDFVFVQSIGRPDLAGRVDEWTSDLWRSMERVRHEWGDGLRVLPAHYADDAERNPDRSVHRELGAIRTSNEVWSFGDEEDLLSWVRAHVADPPDAYPRIKAINAGLATVSAEEADVLEAGKSECAVG